MQDRLIAAVLAMLLAATAAASAGDRPDRFEPSGAPIVLSPPTETGKALLLPPTSNPSRSPAESCVSPLPCGTSLLGTAGKNGAVELQVPALRW